MALGGTIRELQARMSVQEVSIWMAYRKKYGPMNDVRRHDRPAALLGSILSHAHGGKTKMEDLMPFGKKEIETDELSEFIAAFGPGVQYGQRG